MNFINGKSKTKIRQMMKIYIFKIFFYILGNYQDFINYNFKRHGINFFEEFKNRFTAKEESILSLYMQPNYEKNNLKIFNEALEKFKNYKRTDFDKPINEFVDYIINYGFDFFCMISNDMMFSNLVKRNGEKLDYNKYSDFVNKIFDDSKLKLPKITKNLFTLYSNEEIFNYRVKNKIVDKSRMKDIDIRQLEILLYALRFCLKSSNSDDPERSLYSQLISPNCEKNLNENCIPGNIILDNNYVKNYLLLEEHLIIDNKPSNIGAYVCSCGQYFEIAPCGFPFSSTICINCGKKINSDDKQPEYFRIFKDLEQKERENYDSIDKNIQFMLIDEYKKVIIDPILEKEKFGLNKIGKQMLQNIYQKIGKLSLVGYRLLNFILYSHLFYANCLDFISNEILDKYISDGMTIIQVLETCWNLLKDALQSKGIQIQIFINQIFEKLSEKIKNCKEIKTIKEREMFEEEIEILLDESYKEYEAYSKIYIKNNEIIQGLDKNSLKCLILETNDITSYDEREYPFYKYFLMTTYPNKDDFVNKIKKIYQHEIKYPLLTNYIRDYNPEKFLIKYLPEFNKFSNFMIRLLFK